MREMIPARLAALFKGPVARGATGTFALNVFRSGFGFVLSLVLARLLGATEFGAYTFAMSWMALLSVPATFGLEPLLVREVASYRAGSAWRPIRGLLRWTSQLGIAVSVGLALAAAATAWALAAHLEPPLRIPLLIAVAILPPVTLTRLPQAALRGLGQVVAGQVPETLVQPVLFACFIGAAVLLSKAPLGAPAIVALSGVAWAIAAVTSAIVFRSRRPPPIARAEPEYRIRTWLAEALPFLLIGSLHVVNARVGVIMLGAMEGAQATGIYGVAATAAGAIAFALVAVNAPLAPAVARLHAQGDMAGLQRLTTMAARAAFVVALPVALVFIGFGGWLLALFGDEFVAGYRALVILSAAQLLNVGIGSVAVLLTMTGHGRDVALRLGVSVALNLALNLTLIPVWGIEGAAVASASGIAVWNVLLAIQVRRRLGIHPTALGRLLMRRGE